MANEPPVANFTSNFTTVPQGGTVLFYDTSTGNPTSWQWALQISGGTTDYLYTKNISWEYTTAGTFSVSLKVSNAYGENTITKNGYITVTPVDLQKPVVNFTAVPVYGASPLTVQFYGSATNSPEWFSWWIDPNINFSNEQNPVHVFTTGQYSIQLNVGNAVGESGEFKSHYITVVDHLPAVMELGDFGVNPTTTQVGGEFTVSQVVYNTGGSSGVATVDFKAGGENGELIATVSETIGAGSSSTLSATIVAGSAGSIIVCAVLR